MPRLVRGSIVRTAWVARSSIPKPFGPYVYEWYVAAETPTRKRVQRIGTELGLTVVRQCLPRTSGDIAAESDLAKGSTFTIGFPSEVGDPMPIALG